MMRGTERAVENEDDVQVTMKQSTDFFMASLIFYRYFRDQILFLFFLYFRMFGCCSIDSYITYHIDVKVRPMDRSNNAAIS